MSRIWCANLRTESDSDSDSTQALQWHIRHEVLPSALTFNKLYTKSWLTEVAEAISERLTGYRLSVLIYIYQLHTYRSYLPIH